MNKDFPLSGKGRNEADKLFEEQVLLIRQGYSKHATVFLTESSYPLKCFWVETEAHNIHSEFDRVLREYPEKLTEKVLLKKMLSNPTIARWAAKK